MATHLHSLCGGAGQGWKQGQNLSEHSNPSALVVGGGSGSGVEALKRGVQSEPSTNSVNHLPTL